MWSWPNPNVPSSKKEWERQIDRETRNHRDFDCISNFKNHQKLKSIHLESREKVAVRLEILHEKSTNKRKRETTVFENVE